MQRALIRDMIGTMVGDVIAETRRRVGEAGAETIDDVRRRGGSSRAFPKGLREERALKAFLYGELYNAPQLVAVREEAQRVVTGLASAYRSEPMLLPPEWRSDESQVEQLRRIGDFIAGMTDRFAVRQHEELIGPVELPDRF
jgi:dGTPase